jgi:hypothetical protein
VCIPSLGAHDVWVTAIDHQSADPVYYDGDIIPVLRAVSADFNGDRVVGFADFGFFSESYGDVDGSPADLDGDGVVGFSDFGKFTNAFGKCVNESGTTYEVCP